MELLAIKIRNSSIAGIEIPDLGSRAGPKIKIKQLVDDATLFLKNKEEMNISFTVLNKFEGFTGLKLNVQKTKALQICSQREQENFHLRL